MIPPLPPLTRKGGSYMNFPLSYKGEKRGFLFL